MLQWPHLHCCCLQYCSSLLRAPTCSFLCLAAALRVLTLAPCLFYLFCMPALPVLPVLLACLLVHDCYCIIMSHTAVRHVPCVQGLRCCGADGCRSRQPSFPHIALQALWQERQREAFRMRLAVRSNGNRSDLIEEGDEMRWIYQDRLPRQAAAAAAAAATVRVCAQLEGTFCERSDRIHARPKDQIEYTHSQSHTLRGHSGEGWWRRVPAAPFPPPPPPPSVVSSYCTSYLLRPILVV
eukprot:COSAG06_NODE_2707_length_6406_cov_2.662229_7_plen_239_part_00